LFYLVYEIPMVNGQVCQGVRQVPIDIIYVGFNQTTQLTTTIQIKM